MEGFETWVDHYQLEVKVAMQKASQYTTGMGQEYETMSVNNVQFIISFTLWKPVLVMDREFSSKSWLQMSLSYETNYNILKITTPPPK